MDVRPLREMTGHAMFNEVFMSDARVGDDAIIGGKNNGWAVANTTLGHERAGLGAGGGGGGGFGAIPGTVAQHLDKRAGDYVMARGAGRPKKAEGKARTSTAQLLIGMAQNNGKISDPVIRQGIAKLHTLGEIGRYNAERVKAAKAAGRDIPGMGNISKLAMSDIVRTQRDLGLQIIGPYGTLHAYDDEQKKALDAATGNSFLAAVTTTALYAQAPPIYGGTDQIQRNIIGERVLGLPKEPNNDKVTPFKELPKNG
jgi:alkylation response protein AidB-like acyl-CoA dehydrogenase